MKIKLKLKRTKAASINTVQWPSAEPFFVNPRGWLVHRVKEVYSHLPYTNPEGLPDDQREPRHYSLNYWCGNGTCFSNPPDELVSSPPEGKLLCAICEAKAVAAMQPTADSLAGRHVHIGVMRPIRTCCKDNRN